MGPSGPEADGQALRSAFSRAWAGPAPRLGPGLGERLDAAWERARREWSALARDPSGFAAHLARHVPAQADPSLALDGLAAPDLLLAFASLSGEPGALAELDGRVGREATRTARRFDPSPAFADELAQELRQRLLVAAPGANPKLAEYAGRGPLDGWLRAVSVRLALDLWRGRGREDLLPPDALPEASAVMTEPELRLVKARYRGDFNAALRDALAGLTSRERNVLRMRVCERLSADRIGEFYGVHRITVGRWVTVARERVMERMRARLLERLGLAPEELSELIEALRSQLDLSVSCLLSGRSLPTAESEKSSE
jgi:RNA polymerase sigma-70 factor (ECF subfamily)